MAELTVDDVRVRFGGLLALDDVSLHVASGSVTGLIGPNGAGKTTLFDVVTGLRRPDAGKVHLDGRDITRSAPYRRAKLGVGRTFQRLELFGTLSARDNVLMAAETHGLRGAKAASLSAELLERVGLSDEADTPGDLLPTGHARLLELARILAISPSVLLLDEPSAGLDSEETAALAGVLRGLGHDDGLAVLLVEHDMAMVMDLCAQVVVLDAGAVIARGTPAEVRHDPAVQAAYLGTAEPQVDSAGLPAVPAARGAAGETEPQSQPVLELRAIRAGYGRIEVVHGVDLSVRSGQVTAMLGPNGAGKSTLLMVASGQLAPAAGTVHIGGEDVTGLAPEAFARRGVCCVPEGRGVFANLTVAENLRMFGARLGNRDVAEVTDRSYARFPLLAERRNQLAGRLSGGEQHMLALARALGTHPRVLLVDELSMGLAPLVVEQLYEVLASLVREERLGVFLVEQFAQTALALADWATVMVQGRVSRSGTPADMADDLMRTYLGDGS